MEISKFLREARGDEAVSLAVGYAIVSWENEDVVKADFPNNDDLPRNEQLDDLKIEHLLAAGWIVDTLGVYVRIWHVEKPRKDIRTISSELLVANVEIFGLAPREISVEAL